ncbi:MAG: hypothetical protein ABFS19_02975 [Thermodesulfobacteriota bacterium]
MEQSCNRTVGRVFILYGEVTAINQYGGVRFLAPNDDVYIGDQIVSGVNGRVSLCFDTPGADRLDLTANSKITLDDSRLKKLGIKLSPAADAGDPQSGSGGYFNHSGKNRAATHSSTTDFPAENNNSLIVSDLVGTDIVS